MKLLIAGNDRSHDLLPELTRKAEELPTCHHGCPAHVPDHISATSLSQATNESDYLQRYNELLRWRDAVHPNVLALPQHPGWRGALKARLHRLLWRLEQFQRERTIFRQNLINSQLTNAQFFETAQRCKEVTELREKVVKLQHEIDQLRQQLTVNTTTHQRGEQ